VCYGLREDVFCSLNFTKRSYGTTLMAASPVLLPTKRPFGTRNECEWMGAVMFREECLLCNFIDKMFCGTSNECVDEGVFGRGGV
jgi:hypothetical protein